LAIENKKNNEHFYSAVENSKDKIINNINNNNNITSIITYH